jgi:hypothetical protein
VTIRWGACIYVIFILQPKRQQKLLLLEILDLGKMMNRLVYDGFAAFLNHHVLGYVLD